jgi:hypothetical protein
MRAIDARVQRQIGQRPHDGLTAQAATMLSWPAGIGNQRVAFDQQRIFVLKLLARRVVRVAVVQAHCARDAVLGQLRAPATAERSHVGQEELTVAWIDAMHQRDAKIGMMPGDHLFRNRRCQRLEHGVDHRHRKRHPPAHRCGPCRADHAPGRDDRLKIAERAVIDRIIGGRGDALERHLRAAVSGRDAGIVEAAHLFRDVGEIDRHLIADLCHLHLDRNRGADGNAVIIHEGFRFIDAVRNRTRARACGALGLIHDRRDRA